MKNNLFRALFGVLGFSAVFGTSIALFFAGAVSEAKRWCELPCHAMRQTCEPGKTPDPALTCAAVNGTIQAWRKANGHKVTKDMRGRSIEWKRTETGAWRDNYGRDVRGFGGWQVGLRPGESPCTSALKHELWHNLMKKYKGGIDAAHNHPSWKAADTPTNCEKPK